MKAWFVLLLIALLPCIVFAQKPIKVNSEQRIVSLYKKRAQCYYNAKYSSTQRRDFYAFNISHKIILVGFRQHFDERAALSDDIRPNSEGPMYFKRADKTYQLNNDRIVDWVVLTRGGIDSLTDILYNYTFTPVKIPNSNLVLIDEPTGCYWPRNTILFIDNTGKVKEYMEFCFQCGGNRWSSVDVKDVDFCIDKTGMIKDYFRLKGINYGTVKGER